MLHFIPCKQAVIPICDKPSEHLLHYTRPEKLIPVIFALLEPHDDNT